MAARLFPRDEVHHVDLLWELRKRPGTRHSNRARRTKAWIKAREVGIQAAARLPKRLGGGWGVKTRGATAPRSTRFQLLRHARLGHKRGGHPNDYKPQNPAGKGARAAVRYALSQRGVKESPYGSNWGPPSKYIKAIGWNSPIPWCGAYLGWCLKKAGVRGINSRVASVYAIYQDAGAGRNGWARRVPRGQARPGDAVGLFGLSTHVALVVANKGSYLVTCEGNTSSGSGGSQSNGGQVAMRHRSIGSVVYCARPRY